MRRWFAQNWLILVPGVALLVSALVPSAIRGWVNIAFVAVFVTLLVISLVRLYRRDRQAARFNRGDCLHCGYSLTGNVSGVCPEGGTPVRP